MPEAESIRSVGNAAEGRQLQRMEQNHSVAARVRDVALVRCDDVEAHRSAENQAEERKEATETEQNRCLEAAAKLAAEKKSRMRVQAEMRSVQAALGSEGKRRQKEKRGGVRRKGGGAQRRRELFIWRRKLDDCRLLQMGREKKGRSWYSQFIAELTKNPSHLSREVGPK